MGEERATKAKDNEEEDLKGKGRKATKEEEPDRKEEQLKPQVELPLMLRPHERAGT